jgi:hypothetical protein
MKIIILSCLLLSSCSLVQWFPSSNCEYVEYVRFKNHVDIKAECDL